MGNLIRKYFKEEDFEEALEKIDQQMRKIELKVISLSNLRRSIVKKSIIVSILVLLIYFVIWKWYIPRYSEVWLNIGYIFIFPLILLLVFLFIKLNNYTIGYMIESNEIKLENLKKTQELKLDALKKKTDWDRTMQLIDKYEKRLTPTSKQKSNVTTSTADQTKSRLQQPSLQTPPQKVPKEANIDQQRHDNLNPPPVPISTPINEGSRSFVDRFLDYVIGDSPSNGYALICEKCHTNNGLIPKEERDNVQFICKRCSHFNVQTKKKKDKENVVNTFKDRLDQSDNSIEEIVEDNNGSKDKKTILKEEDHKDENHNKK